MNNRKRVVVQTLRECCANGTPRVMIDGKIHSDYQSRSTTKRQHLKRAFYGMRVYERAKRSPGSGEGWFGYKEDQAVIRALLGDLVASRLFKFRDVKAVRAERALDEA